ncbi:MAG: DUF2075 domain-containing protein [Clostridia bacterium]|nr:DUF2075 domain-containing protein [Clostridia bacterium]
MSKPINFYIQSRINNEKAFNVIDCRSSQKPLNSQSREHEISSLRILADRLFKMGVPVKAFDGFFYGYQIPRIGKEFDLLKFKRDSVLNIELKSRLVPEKQILQQLKRNKYYLSHLRTENYFYTVVSEPFCCYKLYKDQLLKADIKELSDVINSFSKSYLSDISNLFRRADFLVSPFKTPKKFINGEYFLTNAQEQIKNKILFHILEKNKSGFYSITGIPGTGKTLLLYDTAKSLSKKGKTLVFHCGKSDSKNNILENAIPDFYFCDVDSVEGYINNLNSFKFILVDEGQSMSPFYFELFKNIYRSSCCIFSYAPEQLLTTEERKAGIIEKIKALPLVESFELSEKIRANREIASFIRRLKNMNLTSESEGNYSDVEVVFSQNVEEADKIIEYFKKKGFFIANYGEKAKTKSLLKYESKYNKNHIVGTEIDKGVMILDNSFYYDENGHLEGVPRFDPDNLFPNMFFHSITRIRERLVVIVIGNEGLFEKITEIL